ncbi:unnamed protein product [Effrenium voratum]|nr:unnamed protein product [Effrenium voratum]
MTGCRCCVFLTIFTLSVVFGKSFPKHVSLVKARFGSGTLWGTGRQGTARGCKDFDVQIFSLCFDIEAYCPLIFGLARPGHPPPSRARICATRVAFLCAFPNPVKPRRQARVCLEIVTSLSQAL